METYAAVSLRGGQGAMPFQVLEFPRRAQSDGRSRLLVLTPQPMFRAALCWTLLRHSRNCEFVEAGCLAKATEMLRAATYTLVLLDEDAVPGDPLETIAALTAQFAVPVALLASDAGNASGQVGIAHGTFGLVAKSASLEDIAAAAVQLAEQARRAPSGNGTAPADCEKALTPAQLKVLMLMEQGQLNKQIAYRLNITESTVKAHVSAIFRKLNVQNRVQATLAAHRQPAWAGSARAGVAAGLATWQGHGHRTG